MKRLLKIEWLKIRSNATFWVLIGLHVGIILLVLLTGGLVVRSIELNGENIGNVIDLSAIPLYQFPDIWHNFTYVAAYLKFILAIYVIISITNEISFDTLRQSIMNGLSRKDFVMGKLFLIVIISLGSTFFLFLTTLVTGLFSTPNLAWHNLIRYSGFIPAYFLELSAYLILALFIGLLIKRTGLAIGLLFLYTIIIEPVLALRIKSELIKGLLPLRAINNLIHVPFGKYALREVQDYVAFTEVITVLFYMSLFIFLTHLLLKKRDL